MKNLEDIQNQIHLELIAWFPKQCKNTFDDYYLYHLPASAEHDGGIVIMKERPRNPDFILSWPERISKGKTVEQNLCYLMEKVGSKLPVLSA